MFVFTFPFKFVRRSDHSSCGGAVAFVDPSGSGEDVSPPTSETHEVDVTSDFMRPCQALAGLVEREKQYGMK